ncbi:hypothetical protein BGZ65_000895 [Modicella reniformis]|uniref:Alpha/beta hydrolase fold-3 domain-containing protein n=1 Tax=Modicella reniformis TaxID=1440133 RepID=A0A9P6J6T5_9FUNG|nr:hypothetical protein BGZ65_000895 [Modicella reniformis]
MVKYTGLYIVGKTPPKQPYMIGMATAMIFPTIECLSIAQYRSFMRTSIRVIHFRAGLGTAVKRAQWATKVHGDGWLGYWIPFQDQLKTGVVKKEQKAFDPSEVPLGTGCDVVVLTIHGGGFIEGHALTFLHAYKDWMKSAQKEHNLRIGILSIQYALAPEQVYPYAMEEIIAAYRDLIKNHGVDPKRIILLGDSAGGNICLGTSIKLRDDHSDLGSPAGLILICPWVRDPEPVESSLFDVVSALGCEIYREAYTQDHPEMVMCPYTSPHSAESLTGLPPMLFFIGGVEILRPSIEQFVDRAKKEGVDVTSIVAEGRPHNYFLLDDISTKKDREEAYNTMSEFAFRAHGQFKQA